MFGMLRTCVGYVQRWRSTCLQTYPRNSLSSWIPSPPPQSGKERILLLRDSGAPVRLVRSEQKEYSSLRVHVSKVWSAVCVSISVALVTFILLFSKYIWLYAKRTPAPAPASADIVRDPRATRNPETLLAEANRLAWIFNWPKAEPLFVRAEELFKEKGYKR